MADATDWAKAQADILALKVLAESAQTTVVFQQDGFISSGRRVGKTKFMEDLIAASRSIENAKKVLLCHPSMSARLAEEIEKNNLQHLVHLVQTPYVNPGVAYVHERHTVDLTKETP